MLTEYKAYRIDCDYQGCKESVQPLPFDYAASDLDEAVYLFRHAGGVVFDGGRAWCREHIPEHLKPLAWVDGKPPALNTAKEKP